MKKESELSIEVGKRIKEIEEANPEITDEAIAECIGKGVAQVRAYKRGSNLMTLTSCVDIIQTFKVDPRFLITGNTSVPIFMEDEEFYLMSDTEICRMHVESLVELLRKLPPGKQVECLGILLREVGKGIDI
ncbi:MAG: hypothetical protein IKN45_02005 [Lachnospiraceae bacterium]|nr:hypothetical protein [Lachnospiraceae bacterium]